MNVKEISIATMTLARDAREEQRLRESIPILAGLDVPVFVTDGGSAQPFLDFLHGFANFRVFEAGRPGLWPQIQRSLRAAGESAAAFILYTEPDKLEFFRDSLHAFISEAPGRNDAGVVLASRSAASFATFPEFQQHTETTINRCCAEVIGEHQDYTYGPFLFKREIVPHLEAAPEEIGWGWRPFAFAVAHRLGYALESVVKDLPCPADQRQDDPAERLYRMRQLSQNLAGLLLSTTAVGTPTAVMINPAPDTVKITQLTYSVSKRQLRIQATSASATLRAYVAATNMLIGTLSNKGGGRYEGVFTVASNPQSVRVSSSLGGSATRSVTQK